MPLSRNNRIDRRRRVMLDAVAADSDYAVETVRAKKRMRARDFDNESDDDGFVSSYRDPGYSQAVRKTCQQRMVQFIPVRRGTLTVVLTTMWIVWAGLMFGHYWMYVRTGNSTAMSSLAKAGIDIRYVAELLHLRSPSGIAHWLTCQLWMMTALSAWLIFQLRRHKLDDYRARYRIWAVLAVVGIFSSFDASTSALRLFGMTIDGWARKEIGYGGWPLVLATFASIVGVLGIRLCSELKSAPTSVACWLLGLSAWAVSALLGTGLIKTTWSQASIDLIVGGCWLGGILSVFQAAGIYLRQTYIHAQKRFLQRQGANLGPIQFKLPKMSLRRNRDIDLSSDEQREGESQSTKRKWRMPWKRNQESADRDVLDEDTESMATDNRASRSKSTQAPSRDERSTSSSSTSRSAEKSANTNRGERETEAAPQPTKARGKLFGFIPNRNEQNERLESEPIREDDGPVVDTGLTKTRGWFGIGGNKSADSANRQKTNDSDSSDAVVTRASKTFATDTKGSEETKTKRSLWPKRKAKAEGTETEQDSAPGTKRNWIPKFGRGQKTTDSAKSSTLESGKSQTAAKSTSSKSDRADGTNEQTDKRSWLSFASRKKQDSANTVAKATEKGQDSAAKSADKPAKKGFFGMFDGLKLNPPSEDNATQKPGAPQKPVPVQKGQQLPSTATDDDDDDGGDNSSGRPMSKAERKKMRRMQQDDRRAA